MDMANYRYEGIKCEACGNTFEYENYFLGYSTDFIKRF